MNMKILMILDHEFPPDIRVENEIQSLFEAGNQVHIACFTKQKRQKFELANNCIIHRKQISEFIHKTSVGALRFPFYYNFWRKFLKELFDENNFDAIHVHDLPMAKVGFEFAKINDIKLTLDLHENWPALLRVATHTQSFFGKLLSVNSQWEAYEKKYCQLANNVIVVVDEAKERLASIGVENNKIEVVSNTLNINDFEIPESIPNPEYITLLYAGGINKHRGLQYVIKGVKHVNGLPKKIRIWILGTGSYVDDLKKLAKEEGVDNQVFFEGWKNYKEMQSYFGKSNICLIPHVKNDHTDSTIPHKIFQYMYAGKPMLVSDCAPIKRIVEETNSGLVYKFDDPKAFANSLKKLVESEQYFSEEFISKNQTKVINDFNWTLEAQKLNSIYS